MRRNDCWKNEMHYCPEDGVPGAGNTERLLLIRLGLLLAVSENEVGSWN